MKTQKRRLFLYAVKKTIPVMLGYIFLGTAFGIVLQRAGLSPVWALVMSTILYAGSMQFAMVPLLAAVTPLPTIAMMTFLVNSRHLFYGLSFVEMFREMKKTMPYMVFSLTDETYSVLVGAKNDPEMAEDGHFAAFCISVLDQLYWVLGSMLGALAGELLSMDTTGIEFAMTALFIVILTEQLLGGGRDALVSAGIGLSTAVVCLLLLGPTAFLLPTLVLTVGLLLLTNRAKAGENA